MNGVARLSIWQATPDSLPPSTGVRGAHAPAPHNINHIPARHEVLKGRDWPNSDDLTLCQVSTLANTSNQFAPAEPDMFSRTRFQIGFGSIKREEFGDRRYYTHVALTGATIKAYSCLTLCQGNVSGPLRLGSPPMRESEILNYHRVRCETRTTTTLSK